MKPGRRQHRSPETRGQGRAGPGRAPGASSEPWLQSSPWRSGEDRWLCANGAFQHPHPSPCLGPQISPPSSPLSGSPLPVTICGGWTIGSVHILTLRCCACDLVWRKSLCKRMLPPSYVCLLQTGSHTGANTFWGKNNLHFLTLLHTLYDFDVFFLHVQSFAVHCGYHHFYRKFILFFNLCTGLSDLLSNYDFSLSYSLLFLFYLENTFQYFL